MSITLGINGFGPLGQSVLFTALADPSLTVTAVVDSSVCASYVAYVIEQEYSRRNPVSPPVRVTETQKDRIILNDTHVIHVSAVQDPQSSLWKQYGANYVIECTGLYTTRGRCWGHVSGGAAGVLIAGASADTNTVMVSSTPEKLAAALPVCSAGAPIGAAVAPVLIALEKVVAVEQLSYTSIYGPQLPHPIGAKSEDSREWRQARLQPHAGCAMIPSREGSVETLRVLLPHLAGCLSARSFQVPAVQGCAIDLVLHTKEPTSAEAMASAFANVPKNSEPSTTISFSNGPIISADCIGRSHIMLDGASLSSSADGKVHRIVVWVDLECYFATVLLSLVKQAYAIHSESAV